jgi:hypothetical protein
MSRRLFTKTDRACCPGKREFLATLCGAYIGQIEITHLFTKKPQEANSAEGKCKGAHDENHRCVFFAIADAQQSNRADRPPHARRAARARTNKAL